MRLLLPAAALLLQACVFVPHTTERYDADCRIASRHMELEAVQLASLNGCSNEGCASLLVVFGATAAASLVISGSIAVVGNVVYWIEHQGRCLQQRRGEAT